MASPGMENNRESYLFEIGKFKDMVRDCNNGDEDDHTISVAEGIACLHNFVRARFFFF